MTKRPVIFTLLNTGLTGVERGAYRAARAMGVPVSGFESADRRDEFGPIPTDLDALLTPQKFRGPRRAQVANIHIASGVVLVVPEAEQVNRYTAMRRLSIAARAAEVPLAVCDPSLDLEATIHWVRGLLEPSGSVHLFITGPRQTRWRDAERAGRQVTNALALAIVASPTVMIRPS